jgi:Carbohydrate-selective porin, OprB family
VPNSVRLAPGFDEYQIVLEGEHRHELFGRPGKIDVTVFESRGRMALLQDAIAYAETNGLPVDPTPVRRYRKRDGVSINLEQQLSGSLGAFVRVGDAGGNVETYEFTDIDYTLSAGLSLNGDLWRRPTATVGLARVVNALSTDRRAARSRRVLRRLRHGRLEATGFDDQDVALQVIERLLSRAPDQQAPQARARDGAHDHDVGAELPGRQGELRGRIAHGEVPARARDADTRRQTIELAADLLAVDLLDLRAFPKEGLPERSRGARQERHVGMKDMDHAAEERGESGPDAEESCVEPGGLCVRVERIDGDQQRGLAECPRRLDQEQRARTVPDQLPVGDPQEPSLGEAVRLRSGDDEVGP